MSALATPITPETTLTGRLYLARAVLALLWAGLLAATLSSAQSPAGPLNAASDLPVLAVVLLILYPVLDVAASLADARTQHRAGRPGTVRGQLTNAAISTVTAVAVTIAALDGPAPVLRVYGAWAVLTGVIQLALAVGRSRRGLRGQWPMILSGGLSSVIGLTFLAQAGREDIALTGLAGYAVGGAVLYLVSAFRLSRDA
ncbi:hypothetical protein [Kineosporia succinea]|uniref:Uncharacterized membrane protein HdeD (DUF308 family) n=1 Tax=Kineosporia succinea TaxID=84632 RepID=A0ABT9P991_9ACTN|nr:hypothetical protein [Kineosporia succinea]MDP9829270.1 uncharacterized membrane protein HdeD (DUF308 family) [Kineosporia succinea]